MKVAISAEGTTLGAPVSRRFGICPYFIIVDLDTGEWEAVRNPGSSGERGAGVQAIVLMISKGVDAVVTGYSSPTTRRHLESNGVDVFTGVIGTIEEALAGYKKGEMQRTQEFRPDVLDRWSFIRAGAITNALRSSGNQFAAMLPILFSVVLLMGLFRGKYSHRSFRAVRYSIPSGGHALGALSPGIPSIVMSSGENS
jgi:predicted Fe-Mo cluster-binding NifX family protein